MTQRPPEGGDDNALRANGLAAVLPRPAWVTLAEHKWVSFRGRRGDELTMALEEAPADVLGGTFHARELHNKWSGQFFSPYTCYLANYLA